MIRLLEAFAATTFFWTFSVGFLVSIIVSITLLFCPALWWFIPLYTLWIWYDRKTCERGGRPNRWIQESAWFRFMKNYFSHKVITGDFELNPKRNYIFACFPHGILPIGPFSTLIEGNANIFKNHKTFTTALGIQFWLPFIRELFLSVGSVSVSAPSIKYLLKNDEAGNVVSILIGGGDEAKYSRPGKNKIILNKRKGFVKMALQNGTSLVPVYTFGETDIFDQLDFPGFGFVREAIKKVLQVAVVIPKGQCLVCPKRVPLVTVVGNPIDVTKTENPTNEQVEALHQKFVEELKKLFDNYKHRYVTDPDNAVLEIV